MNLQFAYHRVNEDLEYFTRDCPLIGFGFFCQGLNTDPIVHILNNMSILYVSLFSKEEEEEEEEEEDREYLILLQVFQVMYHLLHPVA